MDKPLSFSGYKRFIDCPQFYKYHDIDKDRPGKYTSALAQGTMMDDIFNELLLNPDMDTNTAVATAFEKYVDEPMDFFTVDYDPDIIDPAEMAALVLKATAMGWKGDNFNDMIKNLLAAQGNLSKNQEEILRYACWLSIKKKALLWIESYKKWIMPRFEKVHHVQKEFTYDIGNGKVRGILDFAATLKDGRRVLFDNKTSKYAYEPDAPLLSPQLALYAHVEKYDYVGFVVMNKQINKNKVKTCQNCGAITKGGKHRTCAEVIDGARCHGKFDVKVSPSAYVQIQVEKIPQRNKDLIVQAMNDTISCIDSKQFPRNLTNCNSKFGKPCVYFNKCWRKDG